MTYSVWGSFGSNIPTRDVFATETFAILRLLTPPPTTLNTSIEVDGGVTRGDGLGGIFYYDPASVLADDAVNTIAPTPIPATGRWRRLLINVGFAVVTGGVVFGSGAVLAQDAAKFFWDNVNKRLGIGNAVPSVELDITGSIKASIKVATPLLTTTGAVDLGIGTNSATQWAMLTASGDLLTASNNISNLGGPANQIKSGYFGTSVVTPLVGTDAAVSFLVKVAGTNFWSFDGAGTLLPVTNLVGQLGAATNRISAVFTPIIDSGTGASIFLRTGNGNNSFEIIQAAPGAVNWWSASGQAAGVTPFLGVKGEANVTGVIQGNRGTGTLRINDGTTNATQFEYLSVPAATRWITSAASNGGNPVLNTTAGGLDISPATVRFPGIGTTAVAANATLNAVGSNDLLRSTSSQRYKKDWVDLEDADLHILDTIRTIKYKSASEQDDPDLIHYGMLAEDVFKINKNLVTFNTIDVGFDLDIPDWVQYERFIPLLIEQRRRDVKRIEALEAKLGIH